jgi:hypothetical protein
MVGDGVVVDLRQRAFLGADAAGEVAEVIDRQRQIRRQRFPHRLAVIPGFGHRQHFQILFHPVGDPVEPAGPLRRRGAAPGVGGGVRGVQRLFDVLGAGARDFAEGFAGDRADVFEIFAFHRRDPLAADEILIAGFEADFGAGLTGRGVQHERFSYGLVVCDGEFAPRPLLQTMGWGGAALVSGRDRSTTSQPP